MILYDPVDGDVKNAHITWRPRTCFLMVELSDNVHPFVRLVREHLAEILSKYSFELIDADSQTTGGDFLAKIWRLIVSVPVGIAVVHSDLSPSTMGNIFYELGMMQSLGKNTLVVKDKKIGVPSNLVRTEYVEYDGAFDRRVRSFAEHLEDTVDYYVTMAEQTERNPLLAIDYYKRAYLMSGNPEFREKARDVLSQAELGGRAKASVEYHMASFCMESGAEYQLRATSSSVHAATSQ